MARREARGAPEEGGEDEQAADDHEREPRKDIGELPVEQDPEPRKHEERPEDQVQERQQHHGLGAANYNG